MILQNVKKCLKGRISLMRGSGVEGRVIRRWWSQGRHEEDRVGRYDSLHKALTALSADVTASITSIVPEMTPARCCSRC